VFEGTAVLDLSQVFAGPLASRLFAELGATVIKVERPGGEVSRQLPWRINGRSGYFVQQNRGKFGVCIDLQTDEGKVLLWRLIERVDVLIDGFGPGVLERFGFSYQEMASRNDGLIVCEMSALGRSGPLGSVRGYDPIGACYSGVAYTTSSADEPPVIPSVAMGDAMMALSAYGGIVTALYERVKSGKGQRVDVSIVDSYIQAHSSNLEGYSLSGGRQESRPVRGQNATVCPSGAFLAPDGKWMYVVALSNQEWERICHCIGRPEIATDPGFSTNEARVARRSEVIDMVQAWIDRCGDRATALAALMDAGVAAAPVLSIGEVIEDAHLRERGTVEMATDEVLGSFAVPGPPFRLSRSERTKLGPAPGLGEHNRMVFETYGGLTSSEIDAAGLSGAIQAEGVEKT